MGWALKCSPCPIVTKWTGCSNHELIKTLSKSLRLLRDRVLFNSRSKPLRLVEGKRSLRRWEEKKMMSISYDIEINHSSEGL